MSNPIRFSRIDCGDFTIFEGEAQAGDQHFLYFPVEVPPGEEPLLPVFLSGRWSFGPFPDGGMIEMVGGHTGHLNPKPPGTRTLTCIEPGTYLCCLYKEKDVQFGHRRIELKTGESATIRAGATVVLARGGFAVNGAPKASPLVFHAQSGEALLAATSDDCVAVELWVP